MKEVYIDNDLVYKNADDGLFTGIVQSKRKNGHLVYEEEYEKGIILSSNLYYNGKEKRVSNKAIYNPNKPLVLSKEYSYDLKYKIFEITTYNDDGLKILYEQFTNGKVSYSCQYLGKKKHGLELGYRDGGEKMTFRCEYINGKKNGTEYCLNEKGIETKKEYLNGKKIK
ncbi:antitoxin component YwqK of YwqJK toxin-antitoxin module [Saonia flava]|uniref:Antitoxin component YwqK of YwqJK toxin-antitoxin module n=1 Tax=Saonia flava TaxID=523696 RepID=A0A846R4M0_9FLAO|nr:hypothetical protein [Saonia flava]NJB72925.1 antitoxin component YwqK of YwqJK toxin-antitoxin module [Saonia flava]